MSIQLPESDWKYLRKISPELLETLSRRVNDELRALLARTNFPETEKRREAYDLVRKGDDAVAECFDDWRRSTLMEKCLFLQRHGLLTDEHRAHLSAPLRMLLGQ